MGTALKMGQWALPYRKRWKKYVYDLIGAEISTTTRFCDECVQINPSSYDTGLLFDAIECPTKYWVGSVKEIVDHREDRKKRRAFFFNGNFNYLTDIQKELSELHLKLSRYSRLFVIIYNPFFGLL